MSNEHDDQNTVILQELAVEQQPASFMGDDLAAAMTAAGAIYVTIPGMCRALGLDIRGQSQPALDWASLTSLWAPR